MREKAVRLCPSARPMVLAARLALLAVALATASAQAQRPAAPTAPRIPPLASSDSELNIMKTHGEPPQARGSVATVRRLHPARQLAAAARSRAPDPPHRLALRRGVRVGTSQPAGEAGGAHRRGDPAGHQGSRGGGVVELRARGCCAPRTSCTRVTSSASAPGPTSMRATTRSSSWTSSSPWASTTWCRGRCARSGCRWRRASRGSRRRR